MNECRLLVRVGMRLIIAECLRTNKTLLVCTLACLGCGYAAFAQQDGSGIQTSVAVDIVGETGLKPDSGASDQLLPRESELMIYGPIDHLFDGLLSMAAHPENGQILFELHEARISSSRLIPRSRFRLGQFFLGVGRLNQTHRHDWPFITAPYVQEHFFDSEGALDTGLEYSVLMPLPFYLDITVGVTNGFTYGHSHSDGAKPRKPTHYARVATFIGASLIGLNYLGRKANDGVETTLLGVDWVFKSREGRRLVWLVQSEFWNRRVQRSKSDAEDEVARGCYMFVQYGLTPTWSVGTRVDYFTVATAEDAMGRSLNNHKQALVPTVTWTPSEFSRFRLAYEHFEDSFEGSPEKNKGKETQKVQFQATFLLGAHPAHDY